jgi:lipopolysaccharide transport protein LptA
MAISNAKFAALLCMITASPANSAGPAAPEQPIVLDAASAESSNNNLVFRKVRISQGKMTISADLGQGQGQGNRQSAPDFSNSLWTFRGNVKTTTEQGQLASDEAEIKFLNQKLFRVVANGKPALFEGRVEKSGKTVKGQAENIVYDVNRASVELSKDAWLSDGSTEIRNDTLKYTIGQGIAAESAAPDSQRVHITITPPPAKP